MIQAIKEYFWHRNMKPIVIVVEVPPMMRKGEHEDVMLVRHPVESSRRFTNVPYVMGDLADEGWGYEWGYTGCGPTDFALNILLHFTDHDEAIARAFHIEFRNEFLWHMPREGGKIPKEKIFKFLEEMKTTYPSRVGEARKQLELFETAKKSTTMTEDASSQS